MIIDELFPDTPGGASRVRVTTQPGNDVVTDAGGNELVKSVCLDLSPAEIAEHCTDAEILYEADERFRGLDVSADERAKFLDTLLDDLHKAIERGDLEEVQRTLRDYESPRWHSEEECREAYALQVYLNGTRLP